ncbi:MAG TPA: hypothetical protein VD815_06050 [Candidatus Saccharimonadales bacterium]|nr:hypothetical protein [Candidatus Saccharimonadales bacterium]
MTINRYKVEDPAFVFLVSAILISFLYATIPIETALTQNLSSSTSFQVNGSTYQVIPSLGDIQKETDESIPEAHNTNNITVVSNPLSSNPTYSVVNATISVKTSVLEGLNSNRIVLDNQTIITPMENSIVGKSQRN